MSALIYVANYRSAASRNALGLDASAAVARGWYASVAALLLRGFVRGRCGDGTTRTNALSTSAFPARCTGHGILDDDVSTYLPGAGNGPGGANMFNVFSTFDYYLSVKVKPIVGARGSARLQR